MVQGRECHRRTEFPPVSSVFPLCIAIALRSESQPVIVQHFPVYDFTVNLFFFFFGIRRQSTLPTLLLVLHVVLLSKLLLKRYITL